jgi:hypothetical protein
MNATLKRRGLLLGAPHRGAATVAISCKACTSAFRRRIVDRKRGGFRAAFFTDHGQACRNPS